ncbi:MAG: hypothetical protein WBZ07_08500 [Candidatus Dormiibacterota bacterium]
MSASADLPAEVPKGEGHYVTSGPRHRTEAFFVNVAELSQGKHDRPGKTASGPGKSRLTRSDLIFMLDAKKRDWRKSRATPAERNIVLRIGRKLERQGLTAGEFATVSFGISRSTYSNWKKLARRS